MNFIHFIGIDVSQDHFDVAEDGSATKPLQYPNTLAGFTAFAAQFEHCFPEGLVVLEATGGHEMALICFLLDQGICLHRATPLMVKHFIRSLGQKAKTDAIDAICLARFARERHNGLALYELPSKNQRQLNDLLMRRGDLVTQAAAEKARISQPRYRDATPLVFLSVQKMLAWIKTEIEAIEAEIEAIVAASEQLTKRFDILTSIIGIAKRSAYQLQAFMPELGTLNRKTAASLAGCAPHPRDSGKTSRKRTTFGGRAALKRTLFMIAMTARRYDPSLKAFFERLIQNGKPKMVALVAVMRKIVIIANAKLRDAHA
jgi:transposase